MRRNQILTHRGLEPSKKDFYSGSSYEAFEDHLKRGFGVEFDINFTKDNRIVIVHDKDLKRITREKNKRLLTEVSSDEIQQIQLDNGQIPFFDELINLVRKSSSKINALHLKGEFQKQPFLDLLLEHLIKHKDLLDRVLIFDIKPEVAKYFKEKNKQLILAPSVAHPYDIKRYNDAVSGTLISTEDAIEYKNLFEWVWLDEWDLTGEDGKKKRFYTQETFNTLKSVDYKIALVTPELHATSPGLLGGEAHEDAKDKKTLFTRIGEIINLHPDAICTDYPEEALKL